MNPMLDEAAGHAMAGQQIDLNLVLRQAAAHAGEPPRAPRWRPAALAVAAVAAVALLVSLLLPAGVLWPDAEPAAPPVARVSGLPASWYYAPAWTPPVTRHPMDAAVMVLSASLQSGSIRNRWYGPGPVLVSADARLYASLPEWGAYDGGVALSPDGRKVAWWTAGEKDGAGPSALVKPLIVHVLTLATGKQRDVTLPRAVVNDLNWYDGDLYLSGQEWLRTADVTGTDRPSRSWRLDGATGAVSQQICPCWRNLTATFTDGAGPGAGPTIASRGLGISPDGLQQAVAVTGRTGWDIVTTGSGVDPGFTAHSWPVTADEPITGVHLLAWTRAGLVLAVDSSNGLRTHHSIRVMDPGTGASQVASRARGTSVTLPVAVAADLITSAEPIAAPEPSFAGSDRAHVWFLIALGWNLYRGQLITGAVLLVALLVLVLVLVLRRRRRDAPALGGADQA